MPLNINEVLIPSLVTDGKVLIDNISVDVVEIDGEVVWAVEAISGGVIIDYTGPSGDNPETVTGIDGLFVFAVPKGVTSINVCMCGAGGSGGGDFAHPGSGGGGSGKVSDILDVEWFQSFQVVVPGLTYYTSAPIQAPSSKFGAMTASGGFSGGSDDLAGAGVNGGGNGSLVSSGPVRAGSCSNTCSGDTYLGGLAIFEGLSTIGAGGAGAYGEGADAKMGAEFPGSGGGAAGYNVNGHPGGPGRVVITW